MGNDVSTVEVSPPFETESVENISEEEEVRRKKRKQIASEILATENAYTKSLENILRFYMLPIRAQKILSVDEISAIFSNIDQIGAIHFKLNADLKKRISLWNNKTTIGDIFLRYAEGLSLYSKYINNFDNAMKLIQKFEKSSSEFRKCLQNGKEQPESGGLDIMSLLIMPVQRLPRYILLLKDLLKHTQDTHEDYRTLRRAVTGMEEVTTYLNSEKRQSEKAEQLASIEKSIRGELPFPLVNQEREILEQFALKIRDKGKFQEGKCYLFSDCILLTRNSDQRIPLFSGEQHLVAFSKLVKCSILSDKEESLEELSSLLLPDRASSPFAFSLTPTSSFSPTKEQLSSPPSSPIDFAELSFTSPSLDPPIAFEDLDGLISPRKGRQTTRKKSIGSEHLLSSPPIPTSVSPPPPSQSSPLSPRSRSKWAAKKQNIYSPPSRTKPPPSPSKLPSSPPPRPKSACTHELPSSSTPTSRVPSPSFFSGLPSPSIKAPRVLSFTNPSSLSPHSLSPRNSSKSPPPKNPISPLSPPPSPPQPVSLAISLQVGGKKICLKMKNLDDFIHFHRVVEKAIEDACRKHSFEFKEKKKKKIEERTKCHLADLDPSLQNLLIKNENTHDAKIVSDVKELLTLCFEKALIELSMEETFGAKKLIPLPQCILQGIEEAPSFSGKSKKLRNHMNETAESACLLASGAFKFYVEDMKLSRGEATTILHPQGFCKKEDYFCEAIASLRPQNHYFVLSKEFKNLVGETISQKNLNKKYKTFAVSLIDSAPSLTQKEKQDLLSFNILQYITDEGMEIIFQVASRWEKTIRKKPQNFPNISSSLMKHLTARE